MQTITVLLATIGALCLFFAGLTALVARFERPNRIHRVAPMMREEYKK